MKYVMIMLFLLSSTAQALDFDSMVDDSQKDQPQVVKDQVLDFYKGLDIYDPKNAYFLKQAHMANYDTIEEAKHANEAKETIIKAERIKHDQDWFCTEEASQRTGNLISACGVGTASDQASARNEAFKQAKAEFINVCNSSSDCVNHQFFAEPKRLTCEKIGGMYVCYRLVVFTIGKPSNYLTTKVVNISEAYNKLFGVN